MSRELASELKLATKSARNIICHSAASTCTKPLSNGLFVNATRIYPRGRKSAWRPCFALLDADGKYLAASNSLEGFLKTCARQLQEVSH